jgi:hypothetical protein
MVFFSPFLAFLASWRFTPGLLREGNEWPLMGESPGA